MDQSEFEPYLIYNESGEITGIKQDAPVEKKISFTNWFNEYKDKERLKQIYQNDD